MDNLIEPEPEVNGSQAQRINDRKERNLELLTKLPPINSQNVDETLVESLNVYLGLVKQGRNYNYNTSLKNTKNFSNVEAINTHITNFEIEEYGSNYPSEIFDLKSTITADDYFEVLIRRQAEGQGFVQPVPVKAGQAPPVADKSKKSLWDSTADPSGTDPRYNKVSIAGFLARRGDEY